MNTSPDTCTLPPAGWSCSLEKGHDGPCPTHVGKTPRMPKVFNFGVYAVHDQACPVYWSNAHADFNCNTGIFHPSHRAQAEGWRLVQANTWFKRLVMRIVFGGAR
jgi:hypothetical protein